MAIDLILRRRSHSFCSSFVTAWVPRSIDQATDASFDEKRGEEPEQIEDREGEELPGRTNTAGAVTSAVDGKRQEEKDGAECDCRQHVEPAGEPDEGRPQGQRHEQRRVDDD